MEVRDVGLLESAVHRPRASVLGQDAYPDVLTKAARCCTRSPRNHRSSTATSGSRGSRRTCSSRRTASCSTRTTTRPTTSSIARGRRLHRRRRRDRAGARVDSRRSRRRSGILRPWPVPATTAPPCPRTSTSSGGGSMRSTAVTWRPCSRSPTPTSRSARCRCTGPTICTAARGSRTVWARMEGVGLDHRIELTALHTLEDGRTAAVGLVKPGDVDFVGDLPDRGRPRPRGPEPLRRRRHAAPARHRRRRRTAERSRGRRAPRSRAARRRRVSLAARRLGDRGLDAAGDARGVCSPSGSKCGGEAVGAEEPPRACGSP